MNGEQARRLLRVHRDCGVPLLDSVELLFRVRNQPLNGFAKASGLDGTHLRQALATEHPPSPEMRAAVARFLEVDPWLVYRAWNTYRFLPRRGGEAAGHRDGPPSFPTETDDSPTLAAPEPECPGGRFLSWIAEGLREGRIPYNTAKARVHVVPEGVLLASPGIFKDYAARVGAEEFEPIQKSFLRLRCHRYAVSGSGAVISGLILPEVGQLFGGVAPEPNPRLLHQ